MQPQGQSTDLESVFRGLTALLTASFVAALVPAIAVQSMFVLATAFFVTFGHAALLGIPLFLAIKHFRPVNAAISIFAGLIIGIIPAGIESWPSETRTGHSALIDNIPTRVYSAPVDANWHEYAQFLILPGALGALAGFTFWLSLEVSRQRRMPKPISDRGSKKPWRDPIVLVTGLALLTIASASAYSALGATKTDNTCHNMFRDDRKSISPKLNMGLQVDIEDWAKLAALFEEFGTTHSLSLRKSGSIHPGVVRTLTLSLCSDAGLNIEVHDQRWASRNYAPIMGGRGTSVSIFETIDGSHWQEFGAKFANELEARWPGKLKFIGPDGREIPKPDNLTPNAN